MNSQPQQYRHASKVGTIKIVRQQNGHWQIESEEDVLGMGYLTAQQAVDDVSGGSCDWVGTTDTSTIGLSDDLGDWTPVFAR